MFITNQKLISINERIFNINKNKTYNIDISTLYDDYHIVNNTKYFRIASNISIIIKTKNQNKMLELNTSKDLLFFNKEYTKYQILYYIIRNVILLILYFS